MKRCFSFNKLTKIIQLIHSQVIIRVDYNLFYKLSSVYEMKF